MIERLRYVVSTDTRGFSTLRTVGVAAFAAIAAGTAQSVRIAATFDRQLSELGGVSRATGDDLDRLAEQARELGRSTEFTATQVLQAQTALARLGFTTNEILNSSGGVLDLALGLRADLAPAAELVGATLRQFQLDSSETTRVVDVLARSATDSALNFERLSNSLRIVAPVANTLGFSLEETTALLGILANAGIDASTSGTSLRRAFIDLNEAGISLDQGLNQVRSSSDPLATAVELVGVRAATAFVVLSEGIDDVDGLTEALNNSQGAASDLAAEIGDNLIGDYRTFVSALEGLAEDIGRALDGPLRGLLQWTTDFINGTDDQLGALDSLNRAWLFFYETLLLAGRAAELTYQALVVNNPLGDGIIPIESLNRLIEFNDELAEVNARIIELSGGFGTGGGGNAPAPRAPRPTTPRPGGGGGNLGGGTSNFFNPFAFNQGADAFTGLGTTTDFGFNQEENPFTMLSDASDEATENIMGNNQDLIGSFSRLGASITSGTRGGEQAVQALVAAIIPELVQLALANSVTSATQSATGSGPAAAFVLPALLAFTGGIVSSAFNSAGVSSPSLGNALSSSAASGGFIASPDTSSAVPVVFQIDGENFNGMMLRSEQSAQLVI